MIKYYNTLFLIVKYFWNVSLHGRNNFVEVSRDQKISYRKKDFGPLK